MKMPADLPSDAELNRKLGRARMRILQNQGFFGMLLLHMRYALDDDCDTIGTDGESIVFGTAFLAELSPPEMDFVLLHEIMHVALGHCFRTGQRERERFDTACDIVVNSLLLKELPQLPGNFTIAGSRPIHFAPDGKEGHEYSAEQVYELLPSGKCSRNEVGEGEGKGNDGKGGNGKGRGIFHDDHALWGKASAQAEMRLHDLWQQRLVDAALAIEIQQATCHCGNLPLLANRILQALRRPQNDWRALLRNFIQTEVNDYAFAPPDRRFQDSPFLMPDWNEVREKLEKLWFVVDASGSISDEALTAAYGEIIGALEEFSKFDGSLDADLSFFDTVVTDPRPFASVDSLLRIMPKGGGGTNFHNIFNYMAESMTHKMPSCIIILTDGYADFPPESAALRIPVLWVVNNLEITPPWGKVARITI